MSEELALVPQLAIILIAAGVFTIISKALKQPLILGYIIAGFIVGPHLGIFPQFSPESVKQWSDIGIIFLLFSLGLEFSFKKLLAAGRVAIVTAFGNCLLMFMVGLVVGDIMNWTMMESVFLGGLLSMSSTSIIIKAYEEMGKMKEKHAPLVFSILVVEDLIAVVMMVMLSTIAVSNQFAGGAMLMGIAKLVFFIVLWFLVGIYVIPSLLKKAKSYLNDEILLLVSIGLCFLMVVVANLVGFSSELGAFVMGSILSETIESERIEKLTSSLKDLFGAVFFVSVGMMIDPAILGKYWSSILLISLTVILFKPLCVIFGVLISGRNLETATKTGMSIAQLGEFSFIIASLGVSLGVMRDFIYPIIIAVSALTAFTTPYIIQLTNPTLALIRRKLPSGLLAKVDFVEKTENLGSRAEQSEWKSLMKSFALSAALYGVILFAIVTGAGKYMDGIVDKVLPSLPSIWHKIVCCTATILLMSPFIYGLNSLPKEVRQSAGRLIKKKSSNGWPIISMVIIKSLLSVAFLVIPIFKNFDLSFWAIILVAIAVLGCIFIVRKFLIKGKSIEDTFLANLNAKEMQRRKEAPVTTSVRDKTNGYDVLLERFVVRPDFQFAGKTLREMPFRHQSGVNIIKINRGGRNILIPSGGEPIYPGDVLLAVGSEEQIASFLRIMEESSCPVHDAETEFAVEWLTIAPDSILDKKQLRDTNMRASGCMIISVVRGNKTITNPKPEFVFEAGDSVCIAGEKASLEWYAKN